MMFMMRVMLEFSDRVTQMMHSLSTGGFQHILDFKNRVA